MPLPNDPDLYGAQMAMKEFCLGGPDPTPLLAQIEGSPDLPALDRLNVHRNNTRLSLIEALAHSYPVVARLVGEDFFAQLAREFLCTYPPTQAPLLAWGREMASFIDTYPPTQSLPYLRDVAALETAWSNAYHATEAPKLDPAFLGSVDPERIGDVHLGLHPSARFISSRYPVEAIWRANQPDSPSDGSVELVEDDYSLLVFRPEAEVILQPIGKGAFAFLMALALDQPLGVAWDAALAVQDDFQLVPELAFLLSIGIFSKGGLP